MPLLRDDSKYEYFDMLARRRLVHLLERAEELAETDPSTSAFLEKNAYELAEGFDTAGDILWLKLLNK